MYRRPYLSRYFVRVEHSSLLHDTTRARARTRSPRTLVFSRQSLPRGACAKSQHVAKPGTTASARSTPARPIIWVNVVVSDKPRIVQLDEGAPRASTRPIRGARDPPHAAPLSGVIGDAHTPGKRTRLTHPRPPTPRQSRPRGDPRRTLTLTRPRERQSSQSARWRSGATSRSRVASAPATGGERSALDLVLDAECTCARRDFSWRSSRSRCRARGRREPSNTRSSPTAPRSRARRRRH